MVATWQLLCREETKVAGCSARVVSVLLCKFICTQNHLL